MRQQKDWTKIIPLFAIGGIVGMLVLGAFPDIWEGTGAADTVRGATRGAGSAGRSAGGHAASAGSSIGEAMGTLVPKILLVIGVIIGLIILFKIIGNRRSGSSGRTALRRAERDEYQAITSARSDGQRAVHQAQVEAQQRRDEAIRLAQQWSAAEQDRWV